MLPLRYGELLYNGVQACDILDGCKKVNVALECAGSCMDPASSSWKSIDLNPMLSAFGWAENSRVFYNNPMGQVNIFGMGVISAAFYDL